MKRIEQRSLSASDFFENKAPEASIQERLLPKAGHETDLPKRKSSHAEKRSPLRPLVRSNSLDPAMNESRSNHGMKRQLSTSELPLPAMRIPTEDWMASSCPLPEAAKGPQTWQTDPALSRNIDVPRYLEATTGMAYQALGKDERDRLRDYTNNDFRLVNAQMRSGMSSRNYKVIVDKLINAGLDVQSQLFRGLDDHRLIEAGTNFRDPAPGSSSVTPDIALNMAKAGGPDGPGIVLHIFGARAANVSAMSEVAKEAEALIRPNEEFQVLLKEFDPKANVYRAVLARLPSETDGDDAASILSETGMQDSEEYPDSFYEVDGDDDFEIP